MTTYRAIDVDGLETPPLDIFGLKYLESTGRINDASLVRAESSGNWVPFASLRGVVAGENAGAVATGPQLVVPAPPHPSPLLPQIATSGAPAEVGPTHQRPLQQPAVLRGIPADFGYAAEPWSRLWAYLVDTFLLMLPGNLVIGLVLGAMGVFNQAPETNDKAVGIIVSFICSWTIVPFGIAASQALFGTTPGKAMFGIRVLASDGSRPPFGVLLARNYQVLIAGLYGKIPVILLVGVVNFYQNLTKGVSPRWDDDQSRAYQRKPEEKRGGAMVGAAILVVVLIVVDTIIGVILEAAAKG